MNTKLNSTSEQKLKEMAEKIVALEAEIEMGKDESTAEAEIESIISDISLSDMLMLDEMILELVGKKF